MLLRFQCRIYFRLRKYHRRKCKLCEFKCESTLLTNLRLSETLSFFFRKESLWRVMMHRTVDPSFLRHTGVSFWKEETRFQKTDLVGKSPTGHKQKCLWGLTFFSPAVSFVLLFTFSECTCRKIKSQILLLDNLKKRVLWSSEFSWLLRRKKENKKFQNISFPYLYSKCFFKHYSKKKQLTKKHLVRENL